MSSPEPGLDYVVFTLDIDGKKDEVDFPAIPLFAKDPLSILLIDKKHLIDTNVIYDRKVAEIKKDSVFIAYRLEILENSAQGMIYAERAFYKRDKKQ